MRLQMSNFSLPYKQGQLLLNVIYDRQTLLQAQLASCYRRPWRPFAISLVGLARMSLQRGICRSAACSLKRRPQCGQGTRLCSRAHNVSRVRSCL